MLFVKIVIVLIDSKTMVSTFLAVPTKCNCDACLTKIEIDMVASQEDKILSLESNLVQMSWKLDKVLDYIATVGKNASTQKVPESY